MNGISSLMPSGNGVPGVSWSRPLAKGRVEGKREQFVNTISRRCQGVIFRTHVETRRVLPFRRRGKLGGCKTLLADSR